MMETLHLLDGQEQVSVQSEKILVGGEGLDLFTQTFTFSTEKHLLQ